MTTEPDPAAPTGSGSASERAADASSASSSRAAAFVAFISASVVGARRPGRWRTARGIIVGAILIVLGLLFLAERLFDIDLGRYGWPLFVVLPGVLLFFASLVAPPREGPAWRRRGCIVTVGRADPRASRTRPDLLGRRGLRVGRSSRPVAAAPAWRSTALPASQPRAS